MKNLVTKIQNERRRRAFLNRKLAALTDDTLLDRMTGKQPTVRTKRVFIKKGGLVHRLLVAIS